VKEVAVSVMFLIVSGKMANFETWRKKVVIEEEHNFNEESKTNHLILTCIYKRGSKKDCSNY